MFFRRERPKTPSVQDRVDTLRKNAFTVVERSRQRQLAARLTSRFSQILDD